MKIEFKKWLTALLIKWAFKICPESQFKTNFAWFIAENIMEL